MRIYLLVLLFLCLPLQSAFPLFTRITGIENSRITRVAISPFDSQLVYVASKNALFLSADSGSTFEKKAVFPVEDVVSLFFDPQLAGTAYLATTKHLYKIGQNQEQLFTCPDEARNTSVAKSEGYLYVGTTLGLYRAQEELLKFQKVEAFDGQTIYTIEAAGKNIYIGASRGVFVYNTKNNQLSRAMAFREQETTGEETSGIVPCVIAADIFDATKVWLGTSKGLFCSADSGKTWKKFHAEGMDALAITVCAQTRLETDALYLGTNKGIFRVSISQRQSEPVFEGLSTSEVNWIAFTGKGVLYAATADGLFSNTYFTKPCENGNITEIFRNEPTISEVQLAALRYNETHPDKIRRWRCALKARALFPTLSLSYDKTVYGSSTGQFATGPRDWGLTLAWNIGDLIWNSYEDDVDTRSRLNTELRIDILDEINRVYFERRRLKHELGRSSLSEQELFQKNLRLEELTALLDGYTGGFYSKRAEALSRR